MNPRNQKYDHEVELRDRLHEQECLDYETLPEDAAVALSSIVSAHRFALFNKIYWAHLYSTPRIHVTRYTLLNNLSSCAVRVLSSLMKPVGVCRLLCAQQLRA